MKKLLLLSSILILSGCAHLKSTTTETTDPKTQVVTRKTKVSVYTFYDSKSDVAKFKNSITDKTTGTTIGGLSQEASGTNANALVSSVVEGAIAGAMKFAK